MKLKEKLYKKVCLYKGKSVNFFADKILLPNKKVAIREYIDHPGAVTVLPILDEQRIVLVKQYRYPVGKITYELPAGKLDKHKTESLKSCVLRELEEETGYKSKTVHRMLSFWPTPAFGNEIIHIFVATNLFLGKKNPDEDEFLHTKIITFNKALQWVKKGKIKDSKSVIGILYWKIFCEKK